MKSLIFLLFVVYTSSINFPGRLRINNCKGGQIENGICNCPNNTILIGRECRPCIGGSIRFNSCTCPQGRHLERNECVLNKICPRGYLRLYNYTCIKECPDGKIRKGNICQKCPPGTRKIAVINSCQRIRTYVRMKPVIYLYPKETMDISVQLNIKNSKFTVIYPKFNAKNTWNVRAKPNGNILIKDKTYPYLFWEADSYTPDEMNEGFIVSEENAEKFLEEKLDILGLNDKEKTDFITFWLPILLKNKLSLCSFQSKQFFNDFELNITPKPDSLIRVFLSIKKLDGPINIKEQKLISNERKGFTVIEWGGSKY